MLPVYSHPARYGSERERGGLAVIKRRTACASSRYVRPNGQRRPPGREATSRSA